MIRRTLLAALVAALLPATGMSQDAAQSGDIVVDHEYLPEDLVPAPDPKELNEGISAALDEINGRGGIQGRKVSLIKLDDTYTFEGFRKQLDVAMARKPVALLVPLGSATLKSLLDSKLLDSTDIVILNAVPGASVLRSPGHPKLFHIRAGDEQQIQKIVTHARTLNIRSMGVLHQNIPIGSSGLASARSAATRWRWRSSSASSDRAVSARSSGRPEDTSPAICRVQMASPVALNTGRVNRRWPSPGAPPCAAWLACTMSTASGTRAWARSRLRAALAVSASRRPLRVWPWASRASKEKAGMRGFGGGVGRSSLRW